ncbi:guanine deaminase [Polychaeton citri CBS 116435]|uniref:Guanine deaminase n=1 Tax=Polychaeton citri CBS 116435 TaxID=1314669 RepID=A0A9P4Q4S2_9PEZI|nr:guanine deaminase [Polychaeton citri CBS 116435]
MVVKHNCFQVPTGLHVLVGRIIHSKRDKTLEILPKAAIGVKGDGSIAFVRALTIDTTLDDICAKHISLGLDGNVRITHLEASQFLFPGLIDTHLHAPQWPNLALGMDGDLRKWIEEWTDPVEASYSDTTKATKVYDSVVRTTLSLGSTTVAYNSSKHVPATNILADTCLKYGQRAIIGKLSVTVGSTKGNWEESTSQSLEDSEKAVRHIRAFDRDERLIKACIQPRGGPFCPGELMEGMGRLARKHRTYVQTHCCETTDDIERTLRLHPNFSCYTDMYKAYGLLHEKSILAHCIHLEPQDVKNLIETRAAVAHNPNSNTCLRDGECNVRYLLDRNIKVGLGTDCSAGYMPSILDAMRQASNVSRHLAMRLSDDKVVLSFSEMVWLATLGGAEALGMEDRIGNFSVGKMFDALLVDVKDVVGVDESLWEEDGSYGRDAIVRKWVFMSERSSIRKVWVDGRLVAGCDV